MNNFAIKVIKLRIDELENRIDNLICESSKYAMQCSINELKELLDTISQFGNSTHKGAEE